MCGRFVQIIDVDKFLTRFGVRRPANITVQTSYNVAPGDKALVITNDKPNELQEFQFGLTPRWAKKQMFLINARSEGDNNKEDDIHYSGEMGIVEKPAFRDAIQSRRCIILANGYIEGPKKERLNKPYLISKQEDQLFSFAGIWDKWTDPETGELVNSFSIITTVSNKETLEIGHNRSPVILDYHNENKWLNTNLPLKEVLHLLKPYKGDDFNIRPISIRIKDPKTKVSDLFVRVDSYMPEISSSTKKNKPCSNSDTQKSLF